VRGNDLNSLSIDELWKLHEEVAIELARKLQVERARLEQRLRQLRGANSASGLDRPRRAYPPVPPKYQNPTDPMQTWSGRGKQPRWVGSQIQAGRRLDDFLIDRAARRQ
jgi:DNA-binding protein H-NS